MFPVFLFYGIAEPLSLCSALLTSNDPCAEFQVGFVTLSYFVGIRSGLYWSRYEVYLCRVHALIVRPLPLL